MRRPAHMRMKARLPMTTGTDGGRASGGRGSHNPLARAPEGVGKKRSKLFDEVMISEV